MAASFGSASSPLHAVNMAGDITEYLVRMVRRHMPATVVIPGTTPVIAFGDPRRAEVATLGINPSRREFIEGDCLLTGVNRRLATLDSLDAETSALLTDSQVEMVVEQCVPPIFALVVILIDGGLIRSTASFARP
jgi:hypothetical protein